MSAFQDFGPLSEKRKADLLQRRQKKIAVLTAASLSTFLLLVLAGVAAAVYFNNRNHAATATATSPPRSSSSSLHSASKASLHLVCSLTRYNRSCESTLSAKLNSTSSSSHHHPNDILKAAVSVVADEIGKSYAHSDAIHPDPNPLVNGAVEVCKKLYRDSQVELASAQGLIVSRTLEENLNDTRDLSNWLSAVMTYQETCVDGFPDGELKDRMKEAMTNAKQVTSNALAIFGQADSLMSMLSIKGFDGGRRLLAAAPDGGGNSTSYPPWVPHDVRRHLEQHAKVKLTPNATVSQDGTGDFRTINDALNSIPQKFPGRYVIYVKAGVYEEAVTVKTHNVTIYGDGSTKSVVTGGKNYVDGVVTYLTATFAAEGYGFVAVGMGFRNTAGAAKHQAVALRVESDRSVFLNCRMEGYQDTLYAHGHFQFYRACVVSGTVDFVFGNSAAVFQNCILVSRRPLDGQQNIVAAQGRLDPQQPTGFVFQSCRFVPDKKLESEGGGGAGIRSYLGRPWKEYSRSVVMESNIAGFISPEGYMPWNGEFALNTLYYAEYDNAGAGAETAGRVKWPGVKILTKPEEAQKFTVEFFMGADWVKPTGAPMHKGFYH